jgi:hypothetical protein
LNILKLLWANFILYKFLVFGITIISENLRKLDKVLRLQGEVPVKWSQKPWAFHHSLDINMQGLETGSAGKKSLQQVKGTQV